MLPPEPKRASQRPSMIPVPVVGRLDPSEEVSSLRSFVKARASLEPVSTYTWFSGDVYAVTPDSPGQLVFGFEGYNVARALECDGGYDLLTREVAFYLDPRTRAPLDTWTNPRGQACEVLHVWNDPVNQELRLHGPRGPWNVPASALGDAVCFNIDVFLAYPSPLPRAQYPEESQSDVYRAAELFQFFCPRVDLDDPSLTSAPTTVSWTRMAPWLPWMRMADAPGQLVYHCRGQKLESFVDLPNWLRAIVDARNPAFREAPELFSRPNETSWTAYRKHVERRLRVS